MTLSTEQIEAIAEIINNGGSIRQSAREVLEQESRESTIRRYIKEGKIDLGNSGGGDRLSFDPKKDIYKIVTSLKVKPNVTHLMIPDTQCKPNISLGYLKWLGEYIVDKQPDVIIHIGDHADMESLSSYDKGKKSAEGKRVTKDIESSIEGMNELLKPLYNLQQEQLKQLGEVVYKPKMVFTLGNHECLLPNTEVLTLKGFKKITEITLEDEVYTRNNTTGYGEWQRPKNIITKAYNGNLYSWNSTSTSVSCTENHRVLVDINGNPVYKLAKDLPNNFKTYNCSNTNIPESHRVALTQDELELAAWLCTDSFFGKGNQVYLYQRESNAHKIRNVLDNLGVTYRENSSKRDIKEICGVELKKEPEPCITFTLSKDVASSLGVYSNKELPDFSKMLDESQWGIFLDTLVDADGSIPTKAVNSRVVYGSKVFCDSLQSVAITKGYSASLTEYRPKQWRVNLNKREVRKQEGMAEVTHYEGLVFCLELENSNFMVRYNNKCHFTGNCRIMRHVDANPELADFLSYDNLKYKEMGWEVYDFLQPAIINGVAYVHFMANPMTGKPYGGAALNILKNVGESFCMGHKQCLDVATRFLPSSGKQQWAIVAGAYYEHNEDYKGHQGNHHWRGVVVQHNVKDGSFNPMFVGLDYLKDRYGT